MIVVIYQFGPIERSVESDLPGLYLSPYDGSCRHRDIIMSCVLDSSSKWFDSVCVCV